MEGESSTVAPCGGSGGEQGEEGKEQREDEDGAEQAYSPSQQRPGAAVDEEQERETQDRVGEQHVAAPDQEPVREAEERQHAEPADEKPVRGTSLLPGPRGLHREPEAQQKSQRGYELALGKGEGEELESLLERRGSFRKHRQVRGAEHVEVRDQDSQDRDAPQHVQYHEPFARTHRR